MTKFDILLSVTPLIKLPSASLKLDCKTVRIFAYSSTCEQSNEPISLLILRKNRLFCSLRLNKILADLTQVSGEKGHVYVFNVALLHISAPKVEKKKVRWADEPRQQSATEGTLEMLTKSPFLFFSTYKKTSPRANDP